MWGGGLRIPPQLAPPPSHLLRPITPYSPASRYGISTLSLLSPDVELTSFLSAVTASPIGPSAVPASRIRLTYNSPQQTFLGGAGINGGVSPNKCISFPSNTRQATSTSAYWILAIPPGYPDSSGAGVGTTTKMVEIAIVVRDGLAYAYAIAARYVPPVSIMKSLRSHDAESSSRSLCICP